MVNGVADATPAVNDCFSSQPSSDAVGTELYRALSCTKLQSHHDIPLRTRIPPVIPRTCDQHPAKSCQRMFLSSRIPWKNSTVAFDYVESPTDKFSSLQQDSDNFDGE